MDDVSVYSSLYIPIKRPIEVNCDRRSRSRFICVKNP